MRTTALWLVTAACAAETTVPLPPSASVVQAGDTIRLAPGEVVTVGRSGVQLVFRTVAGDSRCPIDALCVWPGNAEVRLEARMGQSAWKQLTVNSYDDPHSAVYGAYRFTLVEVSPAQETRRTIEAGDYRIRLAVQAR